MLNLIWVNTISSLRTNSDSWGASWLYTQLCLVDVVLLTLERSKCSIGVFLDLLKSLDFPPTGVLLNGLLCRGIRRGPRELLGSKLSHIKKSYTFLTSFQIISTMLLRSTGIYFESTFVFNLRLRYWFVDAAETCSWRNNSASWWLII